jgi:NADPH:quinone reductase-like Zn-dependent oxidoreductase
MKAILVTAFGGPEALQMADVPDPVAGPGQVLVRVRASGVNFAETRMRAGAFMGVSTPFTIGMESAGVVEAVGAGVSGFQTGDRVFGRARGSHAELVVFDAAHLMHLPDELDFAQGASLPVSWLTAWHSLITIAQLKPGQRVLIEAIASGVGVAALQIAKWKECWVAGTASRDEKVQHALAWGADAAYNYTTSYVGKQLMLDTAGKGADLAMVTIGEATAEATIGAMANEGKLLLYGSTGGMKYGFDLRVANRNLEFIGVSIMTSSRFIPESMQTFREQAIPLFAQGVFKPVIACVLPWSEVAEAHRMVEERKHFGKLVLQMD